MFFFYIYGNRLMVKHMFSNFKSPNDKVKITSGTEFRVTFNILHLYSPLKNLAALCVRDSIPILVFSSQL